MDLIMFSSSQDRNHPISFAPKLFSFCAVLKMVPSTYILFSSQTWIVILNLQPLFQPHFNFSKLTHQIGEGATLASKPTSNLNTCFHQKMIYFCHNKIVVGSTSADNIFKFINPPENTFISACKWKGRQTTVECCESLSKSHMYLHWIVDSIYLILLVFLLLLLLAPRLPDFARHDPRHRQ